MNELSDLSVTFFVDYKRLLNFLLQHLPTNLFSSRDPETKLEIDWDESLYTSVKGLTPTVTFSILLLTVRIIYFFRR